MQKWCPEPFATDGTVPLVASATAAAYAQEAPATAGDVDEGVRIFRREAGFKSPESLMAQLSQQERSQVFDLVQQDVAREYDQREQALRQELEQSHAAELESMRAETREWAAGYGVRHEEALREMAAACARLAVTLAEKIIRGRVEQEPEILVRAIETALFAVGGAEALKVTVHPDDAVWLEDRSDLRETLHIGEIVADRRVDRGGCRISCEGREWDTTLSGQLETLSEVVAEWITTATAPCPDKDGHDPALD
ncbi:MAG: hypothetical protein GY838_07000 [bacterium]|nr:hypothetical protein [bacterium]